MVQQLTITVDSETSIKPLLESAIHRELKVLRFGIERTETRIAAFEEQYSMTSQEFLERVKKNELGDGFDIIDWAGELKILERLQQQQQALQDAKFN